MELRWLVGACPIEGGGRDMLPRLTIKCFTVHQDSWCSFLTNFVTVSRVVPAEVLTAQPVLRTTERDQDRRSIAPAQCGSVACPKLEGFG